MSGIEGDLGNQCLGPPLHSPEADGDTGLWRSLSLMLEKYSCGFATKLPMGNENEVGIHKDHVFSNCSVKVACPNTIITP